MIGRGIGSAAAVVAIDQVGKHLVLQHFGTLACVNRSEAVTGFFDLVSTCNRGMSFGLFNSGQGLSVPLFTIAAAVIVAILIFWLSRVNSDMLASAIGLIIGGAIGNAIDRLAYGAVVDFALFHVRIWGNTFNWYVFNLADVAIVAGVAALLYDSFVGVPAAKAP
jgi:signal peptidase II